MALANLKIKAKKVIKELPYPIGRFISFIPFSIIFGKAYNKFQQKADAYDKYNDSNKKAFILKKTKDIVSYSYHNIPFYKDHYQKHHFHPDQLVNFGDIQEIPIIKKSDLLKYSFNERSVPGNASQIINTGGTTGEPLEFYIENDALAREWAHMLRIWSKINYKRTELKLNFRGRNIGDNIYSYNPVGNEYVINTFADFDRLSHALASMIEHKAIRYLHGYPSAIYEFAKYISNHKQGLLHKLNKKLGGILLGSEYPAPVYRNLIDEVFDCPSISWYGHSEMCILAYEKSEKWLYEPMGSYGYCETVANDSGGYRLIGTSFYNTASPFIRYDTGDLVTPAEYENDLLKSFRIEEGRVGEFIVDKKGHNISLTALIFGRHHSVFGKAKFVQVHQPARGEASIFFTKSEGIQLTEKEAQENFDASNVDLNIKFKIIDEPYRTQSGKVPLLVKNELI